MVVVKVCTVAVPGAAVVGPAVAGAVVVAAVKQTNVIITRGQKDMRPHRMRTNPTKVCSK